MSATRKKALDTDLIAADFAGGNCHNENAIAALRGSNKGLLHKQAESAPESASAAVDAALIIEKLKSGKDEDLREVAALLANAKKLPQGSLNELLRLMMLRGVGSFEQDWLDLIPDGIYTLDGRRQVEWVVRTLHMLGMMQQLQASQFPGMPLPAMLQQSFIRIEQMQAQVYTTLRVTETTQVQAGLRQITQDPQNRAAISAVRDFVKQNPALMEAVAYQKIAVTVATPLLRDLAQSSKQFESAARELMQAGKLNPAAMSAQAILTPVLAQMVLAARELPGVNLANLSPAAIQLLTATNRVYSIIQAAQAMPLSPSMQQAIDRLGAQLTAAVNTPGRVLDLSPSPLVIAARDTALVLSGNKLSDAPNMPLNTVLNIPVRENAAATIPSLSPRAMDPWSNMVPITTAARMDGFKPDVLARITPNGVEMPTSAVVTTSAFNTTTKANDNAAFVPSVPSTLPRQAEGTSIISSGDTRQPSEDARRVAFVPVNDVSSGVGRTGGVASAGALGEILTPTPFQPTIQGGTGSTATPSPTGNPTVSSGASIPTQESTATTPSVTTPTSAQMGDIGQGGSVKSVADNPGAGGVKPSPESSTPPTPSPVDTKPSSPPYTPPVAPPAIEKIVADVSRSIQELKDEYKPSEKIGDAAHKPKEPGEHICGPGCACGKIIGEKVVSINRRPPKLDLAATVKPPEPSRPSICDGCNGEKGCCPGKGKPASSTGGTHVPTQNAEPEINAAAQGTGQVEYHATAQSVARQQQIVNQQAVSRAVA